MTTGIERGQALLEAATNMVREAQRKGHRAISWSLSQEAYRDILLCRDNDITSHLLTEKPPTLFGAPVEVASHDEPIHLVSGPPNES